MWLWCGAAPSTAEPPEEDVVVDVLRGQVVVADLLDYVVGESRPAHLAFPAIDEQTSERSF